MTGRSGWIPALAGVGMLLAACGGSDPESSGPSTAASTTVVAATTPEPGATAPATTGPPVTNGMIAALDLPGGPDWLAADEHGVWVKFDNGSVDLIDPATNAVTDTVDVGGAPPCQGLGAGDGSVWACSGVDVARIDAGHPEVLSVIPLGKTFSQGELAVTEGQMWILNGDGSILLGVLTDTQDIWSRFALPVRGTDLDAGAAGLWVVSSVDHSVVHVDMNTGKVVTTVDVDAPVDVAIDDEVWIGTATETMRVNADTGAVELTIPVGTGTDGGIALTPTEVWVRNAATFLTRIDRTTGAVLEQYPADVTSGGDILYAFGSIWTTAFDDETVFRYAA